MLPEDLGTAGESACREYERRRARDEARLRKDWGPLGGLAVALTPERQSTRAWSNGASGESVVGQRLDRVASESIRVMHDRRIPGTRANIDHVVVTPRGIWVIDAKKYKGRPQLRVDGGLFRPRVERLFIGGRDKTKLVEGAEWQATEVQAVVGGLPVIGVLCFVDADWPMIGGAFSVRAIEVLWARKLISRMRSVGPEVVDVAATTDLLAARFPRA